METLDRSERYLYVYAIVPPQAELAPGVRGVEGEALALVRGAGLAAVTGAVSQERWEHTAKHLFAHQAVVEAVRQRNSALPARFGTVLRGETAVVETLARQREQLHEDLARLGPMAELDLAILTTSSVLRDGASTPAAALPAGPNIRGSGAGARYLRGLMRVHLKAQILEERLRAARDGIDERLSPHAREVRWPELASERIACSAAYLVDPAAVPGFRRAFASLCSERPELDLVLSGPSAPYSFVAEDRSRARIAARVQR